MAEVAPFPAGEAEREVITPFDEERKLLAAIRAGDAEAAEELVERTYSAVFASISPPRACSGICTVRSRCCVRTPMLHGLIESQRRRALYVKEL